MTKTISNLTETIGDLNSEVDDKKEELSSLNIKIKEEDNSLQQRRRNFENEVTERATELVAANIAKNDMKTRENIERNNMAARVLQGNLTKEYSDKKDTLEREYKTLKLSLKPRNIIIYIYLIGCIVISTVFYISSSKYFGSDLSDFALALSNGIEAIGRAYIRAGTFVAQLGDMIPFSVVAFIIHWLLQILVSGVLIAGTFILSVLGLAKLLEVLKKKGFMDYISLFVITALFMICVYGSGIIGSVISINQVVLLLLMTIGYVIVRLLIQMDDSEKRLTTIFFAIVVIAVFIFALASISNTISDLSK